MSFDIQSYVASRKRMIEELNQRHENEPVLIDGVICPEVFAEQRIRILCVLAEPYGYEDDDKPDVEMISSKDVLGLLDPKVKTTRRLAALLLLLQHTLETGAIVAKEDWWEWPDLLRKDVEPDKKLGALRKIAWVNLKKVCNETSSRLVPAIVHQHACANKQLLLEQFRTIKPHVVFVCGRDAVSLTRELDLLSPCAELAASDRLQPNGIGLCIVEMTHPGARSGWGYAGIYERYISIHHSIQEAL